MNDEHILFIVFQESDVYDVIQQFLLAPELHH